MPKHLSHHSEALSKQFVRLEMTRNKVEHLFVRGLLSARDIERVYEGLFMKTVVSLESSLEETFLSLLSGTASYSKSRISPRIHRLDRNTAVTLILGGRSYVDWLPIKNTQDRAKVFFKDGAPFSDLSDAQRQSLTQITLIRNAIAHPSENAREQFEAKVIAGLPLTRAERTPAGYLRSVYRSSPDHTRFEDLAAQCLSVVRTICR